MDASFTPACTEAERRAAFDVAFTAWKLHPSALLEQARRLRAERYLGATWWLAREGAGVQAALVAYPLDFGGLGADPVRGIGLGAVCTRPEARGRRLASRLCAAALEATEGPALLYSAIAPGLYERLGFKAVTTATAARCEKPGAFAASGPRLSLVAVDPRVHVETMDRLWHGSFDGVYSWRDPAAWERSFVVGIDALYLAVDDIQRGYVCLEPDDGELELAELALADPADLPATLRACAALADDLKVPLQGWLRPEELAHGHWSPRARDRTLPMLRGLPDAELERARFWSSDYF